MAAFIVLTCLTSFSCALAFPAQSFNHQEYSQGNANLQMISQEVNQFPHLNHFYTSSQNQPWIVPSRQQYDGNSNYNFQRDLLVLSQQVNRFMNRYGLTTRSNNQQYNGDPSRVASYSQSLAENMNPFPQNSPVQYTPYHHNNFPNSQPPSDHSQHSVFSQTLPYTPLHQISNFEPLLPNPRNPFLPKISNGNPSQHSVLPQVSPFIPQIPNFGLLMPNPRNPFLPRIPNGYSEEPQQPKLPNHSSHSIESPLPENANGQNEAPSIDPRWVVNSTTEGLPIHNTTNDRVSTENHSTRSTPTATNWDWITEDKLTTQTPPFDLNDDINDILADLPHTGNQSAKLQSQVTNSTELDELIRQASGGIAMLQPKLNS